MAAWRILKFNEKNPFDLAPRRRIGMSTTTLRRNFVFNLIYPMMRLGSLS